MFGFLFHRVFLLYLVVVKSIRQFIYVNPHDVKGIIEGINRMSNTIHTFSGFQSQNIMTLGGYSQDVLKSHISGQSGFFKASWVLKHLHNTKGWHSEQNKGIIVSESKHTRSRPSVADSRSISQTHPYETVSGKRYLNQRCYIGLISPSTKGHSKNVIKATQHHSL